jgi:hypothetical protein
VFKLLGRESSANETLEKNDWNYHGNRATNDAITERNVARFLEQIS